MTDREQWIAQQRDLITETVRELLTMSCQLDPDIAPTVRRVRVACALGELMGRDPNDAVHRLIDNVIRQENVYAGFSSLSQQGFA